VANGRIGISASATWVVGLALLADTFPANELGGALGTAMAFNTLGYLIGPSLSGTLTKCFGVETPFYICTLVCGFDFLGRLWVKPQPLNDGPFENDGATERLLEENNDEDDQERLEDLSSMSSNSSLKQGVLRMFFDLHVFLIGIAIMLGSCAICALETILSLYIEATFNGDEAVTGYVLLAVAIPAMFIDVVAGKITDKYEGRSLYKIITLGMLAHALVIPLFSLTSSFPVFLILIVLFGATSAFALAPTMPEVAYIAKRFSRDGTAPSYGLLYAVFNEYYYLGMVLGPFATPWLKELFGLPWAMGIFSIAIFVFAPIYFFTMKRLTKLDSAL
jgi:MFS family permease